MPNRPSKTPLKTYNSGDAALEIMKKMGARTGGEEKVQVNIQMTSEMREAIKAAAKDNQMTSAGYIKWLVSAALKAGGYM